MWNVVLDLMIHDIDAVLPFAASPVREVRAGLTQSISAPRARTCTQRDAQYGNVAAFSDPSQAFAEAAKCVF